MLVNGAEAPVHFVLNDRTGATIVVEFHEGDMVVYDNPVGAMTNGPQFDWHLTNLNNPPGAGGEEGDALAMGDTEYTPWTILANLSQSRVFLRTYYGLNYTMFDLAQLAEADELKVMQISVINGRGTDGTAALLSVQMPQ